MIEQRWWGEPGNDDGGPTLVLLHEGLGSVAQWRDVPDRLHALTNRPVLAYSRAGYGQSSPITPPRPLTYMHDEATQIPRVSRPILIGHSDGASIAIIAAPTVQPVALVLMAPHVFVEDISVESIARARDSYAELRPRLAKYHADVDGAFWGWNRAWLDPGFRAWNIEEYLPRITAPTLIVQGDADEYGTLAQVDAIAMQLGGRYEVEIVPGAGHAPFKSPGVVERIATFVNTVVMLDNGRANSGS